MIDKKTIDRAIDLMFEDVGFKEEPADLYAPLRYMIRIGGKRIRPRLCLTAYSLFRDSLDESVIQPAAALEVFHSFTLIHDDIMDKSEKRRGQPTVWTKWGDDEAILSGDVMCIEAFRRLAFAPAAVLPEVLALFTDTAASVCEGQQLDMDYEKLSDVTMDRYMEMIGLKTAVLLACSAKMGAVLAGASTENAGKLYDYGYLLGLAFQVADDYLDVYGDEKLFGKPIGGDIVNNKKSWMLTRALEKTSDRDGLRRILALPVENVEQRLSKIAAMKAVYDSLELADEAKNAIGSITADALEAVSGMQGYGALESYAFKLVGRVK
ncbi:MAG: polyprenyl synthetase family protein [Bacteroidales bacterium]|nr:polyprenyl synthetase family protein [Bacteroidales bacterium]